MARRPKSRCQNVVSETPNATRERRDETRSARYAPRATTRTRMTGALLEPVSVACLAMLLGCSSSSEPSAAPAGAAGTTASKADAVVDTPAASVGEAGTGKSASAGTSSPASASAGTSADAPKPAAATGTAGSKAMAAAGAAAPAPVGMLDPKVDWKALKLVYATMYSAYDGVHTFQVPVRVEGATVEPSGWSAIPSDAVQFDADPEGGGVLLTMLKATPQVTIAARTTGSAPLGGTATLNITKATPEEWALGQQRYMTGADYSFVNQDDLPPELAGMDVTKLSLEEVANLLGPVKFAALLAELPSKIQNAPPPPTNLKCTNCHSTGAKYFEVQHTPTQIAQVSDADLVTIFTKGMKPAGVAFRVLPKDLQSIYVDFHKWMATEAETKGLIVYLRSLTPKGQGDILGTDGVYRPAQPDQDLITIILNMAQKP
jgi:hypothetical protein